MENVKVKIVVTVGDREIELSHEDARQLYDQLDGVFGVKSPWIMPTPFWIEYPSPPTHQPYRWYPQTITYGGDTGTTTVTHWSQ